MSEPPALKRARLRLESDDPDDAAKASLQDAFLRNDFEDVVNILTSHPKLTLTYFSTDQESSYYEYRIAGYPLELLLRMENPASMKTVKTVAEITAMCCMESVRLIRIRVSESGNVAPGVIAYISNHFSDSVLPVELGRYLWKRKSPAQLHAVQEILELQRGSHAAIENLDTCLMCPVAPSMLLNALWMSALLQHQPKSHYLHLILPEQDVAGGNFLWTSRESN